MKMWLIDCIMMQQIGLKRRICIMKVSTNKCLKCTLSNLKSPNHPNLSLKNPPCSLETTRNFTNVSKPFWTKNLKIGNKKWLLWVNMQSVLLNQRLIWLVRSFVRRIQIEGKRVSKKSIWGCIKKIWKKLKLQKICWSKKCILSTLLSHRSTRFLKYWSKIQS